MNIIMRVFCVLAVLLYVIAQDVEDKVKSDIVQLCAFATLVAVVMGLCVEVYG